MSVNIRKSFLAYIPQQKMCSPPSSLVLYYVHRPDSTWVAQLAVWSASMGEIPESKNCWSTLMAGIPQPVKTASGFMPNPDGMISQHEHFIAARTLELLIVGHHSANLQARQLDKQGVSTIRKMFLSALWRKLFLTDASVLQAENTREKETEMKCPIASSVLWFDVSALPKWYHAPHAPLVVLLPMLNDADESRESKVVITVTSAPLKQEIFVCAKRTCISSSTLYAKEERMFCLQRGQFLVIKQGMFTATMSSFAPAIPILVLFICDNDTMDPDVDKVAQLEEISVALDLLRNHYAMDNFNMEMNDANMETRLADEDVRTLEVLEASGEALIHKLREASPVTGIRNIFQSDMSGTPMTRQMLSSRNVCVTEC